MFDAALSLLVDDDPDVLELARRCCGPALLVASTGADARRHLLGDRVRRVICDLNLGPEEPDGADVLSWVQSTWPHVERWLTSSSNRDPRVASALAAGIAHRFVPKARLLAELAALGRVVTG